MRQVPIPPEEETYASDAISRVEASEPVFRLLVDGHSTIVAWEDARRFERALALYRQAHAEARRRREPESERVAARLVTETERAIARFAAARNEARRDVRAGKYCYRVRGLMPDGRKRDALAREFGIRIVSVAGCLATYEEIAGLEGYNSVSLPAIEKRFGREVARRVKGA